MKVYFRIRYLRKFYVPILNFISELNTRKYVKNLVKNFVADLNNYKNKDIRLVYNFADSPDTFGDFMIAVMLCRLLALSGHQMTLTAVDGIRGPHWSGVERNIQNDRIKELLNLAAYLLPQQAKIELVSNYSPVESSINLDSKRFYAAAPYFLDLLITKYKWTLPNDFLLKVTKNDDLPYVAWHVRKSDYDIRRNFTSSSIKGDFEVLRNRFPDYSIMLISDAAGLEDAFFELTGSRKTKSRKVGGIQLLAQPMQGFQNAIPAVLAANFYFQRGGGGIGVVPIFSSMPYVNLCPDRSYFHGLRGVRIVPWSNKNQLFVRVKGNLNLFQVEKLFSKLKV